MYSDGEIRLWPAMFIFLDESGCLGFDFSKKGTSEYFVITLLICKDKATLDAIKTAVKRTLRNKINHAKKNDKQKQQELKGSKTSFEIKQYFFNQMPRDGWEIYSVILNKRRVYDNLKKAEGKKRLYNYLAGFLLKKVRFAKSVSTVNLIVDKCKNTEEIKDFNDYIKGHLEAQLPLDVALHMSHEASEANTGLQAVDIFCWGIARKHSCNELSWYNLFKKKIREEEVYLPKKK